MKEDVCVGCRLCEVYCLVQHSKSKKILKAYKGEYPRSTPRILVEEKGHISFAIQCRHCDDAPCLAACPTGAMYRDPETEAILCDENKCIGCWMCIMVCPFGAISRGTECKVVSKCDLCLGEDIPACVKNCPNEALVVVEAKEK
ncbi:MAG TPA: 4Fe-4S dicluster domain-containing protein [Hadesarchaea archaeon]|nr:4Fe-4S dicluster domain-containing protein [Hadesarchaea archaeon]